MCKVNKAEKILVAFVCVLYAVLVLLFMPGCAPAVEVPLHERSIEETGLPVVAPGGPEPAWFKEFQ